MNHIPVEKNKEYIVDILDNGYEGEGIAKIDNYTIFVPGAIKDEKVKILIIKVNKSYGYAKIIEILEESNIRTTVGCEKYKRCGGCNLRHIRYEDTLLLKRDIVKNLVEKNLNTNIEVKETIGMENPYNYRNKAQYPVSYNKAHEIVTGVYANRSHEVISVQNCKIQKPISEQIAKFIIDFMKRNNISAYDEKTQKGIVRHIVTKVGIFTNEIMCIIVVNNPKLPKEKELVEALLNNFKNIKTIVKNINMKNTNVIMGKDNDVLHGDGYIKDKLGKYTFKISPLSFYQINPIQTEKLYNLAIKRANLNKDDVVLDLYCGIGTIGIFIADYVKKVYGIEIIPQAIEDAKDNARLNKVHNIQFYCGDVEKVLGKILEKENIKPNIIFVDPPRKGLDKNTIQNILSIRPKKVVYISCNPATLVRDLKEIEDIYEIKSIETIDFFPFTSHVETISVLELR